MSENRPPVGSESSDEAEFVVYDESEWGQSDYEDGEDNGA